MTTTDATRWGDELEPGTRFTTPRRTLIDADIAWFAGWSWDANPVHTDAVDAAAGQFGAPIAHGVMGLSVAMGLISRMGTFEGSSVALLGVEEWRFTAPLRSGDTVHVELEILGARLSSSSEGWVVDRKAELIRHDGVVAQSGRIPLLMRPRPSTV
ncbi:MaoC/PaaZ C-terminal domain-containing protein [Prauserella alba]|uniref:MaoC/PaaZ C-terminal domain-containing protein n=1 Tax=Prauserella alba TaxID=176898 RepID=A0ABN1V7N6_9PSEU|nr:MaoC/PaaZ C-terminal domain-containing protein [Prauserella alba]MCP2181360.1 Acyl dehydratase [Prauserella alba]